MITDILPTYYSSNYFNMLSGSFPYVKAWQIQNTDYLPFNSPIPNDPVIDISNNYIYLAYTSIDQTDTYEKLFVCKYDKNGNLIWSKSNNEFNPSTNASMPNIVVDSMDNIYITYYTANFGVVPTQSRTTTTGRDIVVLKLDTNGNLLWIKQDSTINTYYWNNFPNITLDNAENPIIIYHPSGNIVGITTSLDDNNTTDIVTLKLSKTNGSLIWAKQNTISTTLYDFTPSVKCDTNGNVYIVYETSGIILGQTTSGNSDIVILKLNSIGDLQWAKQSNAFNTGNDESKVNIDIDQNYIYVSYLSSTNTIILKIDLNGTLIWKNNDTRLSNTFFRYRTNITTDANNIYISYYTDNNVINQTKINNDDIILVKLSKSDGSIQKMIQSNNINTQINEYLPYIKSDKTNIYGVYISGNKLKLVKLDTDLNVIFNNIIEQKPYVYQTHVGFYSSVCDKFGNIYCIYSTYGSINGSKNEGIYDLVIFKTNRNGNLMWIKQDKLLNTIADTVARQIIIDNNNNIIIAFFTNGTLTDQIGTNINKGYSDLCIIKLDSDGNFIWTKQNSTFNKYLSIYRPSIAIDIDNDIYISYDYLNTTNSVAPYENLALFKLSSLDGSTIWFKSTELGLDSNGRDWYSNITIGLDKSVYLTYETYESQYQNVLTNIVVCRFDNDGNLIYNTKNITNNSLFNNTKNTSNNNTILNIYPQLCVDKYNNCYVAFYIIDSVTTAQKVRIFKLNPNGNYVWKYDSSSWGGSYSQIRDNGFNDAPTIRCDLNGNIYVGYKVSSNIAIIKFNSSGQILCDFNQTLSFNTIDRDEYPIINLDAYANVYLSYKSWGKLPGNNSNSSISIIFVKFKPIIAALIS